MNFFQRLFAKQHVDLGAFHLSAPDEKAVRKFQALSAADRMGTIMQLGDLGKPEHWVLIKIALLTDQDQPVKMAALKRLGNFPDKTAAIDLIRKLEEQGAHRSLEPYVSMAQVRLGLITEEEFNDRLNNAK